MMITFDVQRSTFDGRRSTPLVCYLTIALFWIGYGSFAADSAAPDDVPVPESAAGEDSKPADKDQSDVEPVSEKRPANDDELTKSLETETREFLDQALDHLQHAFDGMKQARDRIAGEETGAETQTTQEKVVRELEDLLALVRKQQARNQSRSQPNQSSDQNRDQAQSDRQKLPNGSHDPQNSGSARNAGKKPGTPDGRKNGKAAGSEERTDAARVPAAEQARRLQAIKDVWGHLPPHIREAMLNSVSEKYLPKYEDLVKKYYEDLAEKRRKQHGK